VKPPDQYQSLIDVGFGEVHAIHEGCREEAPVLRLPRCDAAEGRPSRGRSIIRRGVHHEEDRGANFPCRSQLDEVRHVCAFFNSDNEKYRVLLPFVKDGFKCGDKQFTS